MTLVSKVERLEEELPKVEATAARLDQQINGPRGQATALLELAAEIRSLRKAAYWVAGLIVAGSVTMAFSALSLVGG